MTEAGRADIIAGYYELIDANDIDGVTALFAESARYERAGAVYPDKPAIARFFREERLIRGVHAVEQVVATGQRVMAIGQFDGVGAAGDPRSVGYVDVWDFGDADLVVLRRTYLATGHEVVQR